MAIITDEIAGMLDDAIKTGLIKGDPGMVTRVLEIQRQEELAESFTNFEVHIVPFTIPDTSLREIVLRCPDSVLEEILDALTERRKSKLMGGDVEHHEGKVVVEETKPLAPGTGRRKFV